MSSLAARAFRWMNLGLALGLSLSARAIEVRGDPQFELRGNAPANSPQTPLRGGAANGEAPPAAPLSIEPNSADIGAPLVPPGGIEAESNSAISGDAELRPYQPESPTPQPFPGYGHAADTNSAPDGDDSIRILPAAAPAKSLRSKDPIVCLPGFQLHRLQPGGATVCATDRELQGPFTAKMKDICRHLSQPGHESACDHERWELKFALRVRAQTESGRMEFCPPGARQDSRTNECKEGLSVVGPAKAHPDAPDFGQDVRALPTLQASRDPSNSKNLDYSSRHAVAAVPGVPVPETSRASRAPASAPRAAPHPSRAPASSANGKSPPTSLTPRFPNTTIGPAHPTNAVLVSPWNQMVRTFAATHARPDQPAPRMGGTNTKDYLEGYAVIPWLGFYDGNYVKKAESLLRANWPTNQRKLEDARLADIAELRRSPTAGSPHTRAVVNALFNQTLGCLKDANCGPYLKRDGVTEEEFRKVLIQAHNTFFQWLDSDNYSVSTQDPLPKGKLPWSFSSQQKH